jgi:uncharacterized membrane protein
MEETRVYIVYIARIIYNARIIEGMGVAIISLGIVIDLLRFIVPGLLPRKQKTYRHLRQDLGKVILLRLEILVAADIIATEVTEPTLEKSAHPWFDHAHQDPAQPLAAGGTGRQVSLAGSLPLGRKT